jgi:hypothetical protein
MRPDNWGALDEMCTGPCCNDDHSANHWPEGKKPMIPDEPKAPPEYEELYAMWERALIRVTELEAKVAKLSLLLDEALISMGHEYTWETELRKRILAEIEPKGT